MGYFINKHFEDRFQKYYVVCNEDEKDDKKSLYSEQSY